MFRNLSCSVLLFVCLAYGAQAKSIDYYSSPFNLAPLMEPVLLYASETLSKHGVSYYDFTALSKTHVMVKLFDSARSPVAIIELKKDSWNGSFLYVITQPDCVTHWVRVGTVEQVSLAIFTIETSTGQSLRMKIETAPRAQARNYAWAINESPIKALSIFRNRKWQRLKLPASP